MLADEIKSFFHGDVATDETTLTAYSRDASLFEVRPELVAFPKDVGDVKNLVRFVTQKKKEGTNISLTARSAGTDMTGGPLTESVVVDFTRYFNHVIETGQRYATDGVNEGFAVTEPGVFYRDFEKETLKKGYILPSYPASRELCAMGGIVSNNSGGERTLKYGKTEDYVSELNVVFSDGNEYTLKPLTLAELQQKTKQVDFEGEIYRKIFEIVDKNGKLLAQAKPKVSKNSAGYYLWNMWDGKTFDLTKLIVGSQGTLGFVTRMKLRLVKPEPYSGMFIIFLNDLKLVADLVSRVLPLDPTSLESYDDYTLKLALKFFYGFLKLFTKNPFSLLFGFLPEFWLVLRHGLPKLTILAEFEEETQEEVEKKLDELEKNLGQFHLIRRVAHTAKAEKKYWLIRRESFNLLRHKVKGMQTAPFVDDIIVNPDRLPEFLPKLYAILDRYGFLYTIAGHVGNGNFHVIPLMKLNEESERAKIKPAMDEVLKLVFSYGGSMTAEHNDGIIRSPYLEEMFGEKVYALFRLVKDTFDPLRILNPGKKVDADLGYALAHMKRS